MPPHLRPISPTAYHSNLSNNATATAKAAVSTSHSPRTSGRQPKHSPRNPPKSNCATSPTCQSTTLSSLGILIFFSVVTNLFFWTGNPLKRGGETDNRRTEAAWSPQIRSREDRLRRVFRDGNLTKQVPEGVVDQRSDAANRHDNQNSGVTRDRLNKHNAMSSDRTLISKTREGALKTSPDRATKQKKKSKSHDEQKEQHAFQSKTKQSNISTVHKELKGTKHTGQRPRSQQSQQKLRSFQLHPIRKKSRLPVWSLSLPRPAMESIKLNGLVLLDGSDGVSNTTTYESAKLESNQSGNATEEDLSWRSQTVVWENNEECVPMSEWQATFHPTCNSLHEMDISLLVHDDAFSLVSSKGHWRSAWKVDMEVVESRGTVSVGSSFRTDRSNGDETAGNKYAVMKSLKYVHDPNEEVFELSRVDAVSLDVLMQSRFTININGYCGTSSVQEFAGGDLKGLLPKLDPVNKLRMAAWIADGIADIHAVDKLDKDHFAGKGMGGSKNDTVAEDAPIPSLIHNDINMDNVLLGYRQGVEVPLLNDFNIAVFRRKDAKTGEPCRFRGRFANPQWMSPEQQKRSEDELSTGYLSEKIDIYALGNILYKIAVGHSPWKYEYKVKDRIDNEMKAKIARAKLRGAKPKVPPEVRNTTDPNVKAVLTAMDRCYRNDAELRPSARDLANYLKSELNAVEKYQSV